jgi:phage RecT family recombinase
MTTMADPYASKRVAIRQQLDSEVVMEQLQAALPGFITPERMVRTFYSAILANPAMLDCTKESLIGCLIACAQLGLEPILGKAWLIPYRNNDKPGNPLEAQFQIGWRGLCLRDRVRYSGQDHSQAKVCQ